jgi:hypothetical protein
MTENCGNCGGIGKQIILKVVDSNDSVIEARTEEVVCKACNGKGYTEYAVFSIEEAEVILKHCGLSAEREQK